MLSILCSGQGNQPADVFARLRTDPAANEVLNRAVRERWVSEDIAAWLTADVPDETAFHLNHFSQPLLCLYQQAVWAALSPHLGRVSLFTGLSLGELSAAACAGALDTPRLLRVAARRAKLMDAAAPPGCLVAVIGLDRESIESLCAATGAAIAIQFDLDHWTLGCLAADRDALVEAARTRGASRVVPLKVTIASHTHWMGPAVAPFHACLHEANLTRTRVPILAGTTAQRLWAPASLIESLCAQLHTTIRWDLCIDAALTGGIRTLLELGPGTTLSRTLIARDPTIAARSVDEFSSLAGAAAWASRH